jgi:hypothetical protein
MVADGLFALLAHMTAPDGLFALLAHKTAPDGLFALLAHKTAPDGLFALLVKHCAMRCKLQTMNQDLIKLYQRDLAKLVVELEAYPNEESIWLLAPEIKNPAGNLALHIVGNLNMFIGVDLGGTDYKRDREAEFNLKNVPRSEMIKTIHATAIMIETVLSKLEPAKLEQLFPKETLGYPMSTSYFLMHLYGHLNWHLGQINYHRRLLTAQNSSQ